MAHSPFTLLNQAGTADRFVTLVAIVLDTQTHTVTVVNAGHPAPLVVRQASGEIEEAAAKAAGLPLGVLDGFTYDSCQVVLQPGDCILAFTDGVSEAMDRQHNQFQVQGILQAIREGWAAPAALGERIVGHVKKHAAGRSQNDDITLVCLGRAL